MAGHVPVCSELEAELIFAYAPIGITVGVAYLGVAMSALAYGVTCCQTFYYYRSEKSKQDHWSLRVLVAFLWLVTGLQEALIIHGIYWYLVTNFMNPCTLISKVIWSIPAEIFLNSPLEIGVEGFLLYRVWKLSRNIIVTGICAAVVVVASVLNIMYSTELLTIQSIQDALEKLRWLGISSLGTSVVADAMITVALVYYLYKSRTGFRRSDDLVTRLTVLTISTGALTTLVTLAELMAYQFGTHGFYVVFFTFLVGKLYLNCMLTTLNMRSIINGISSETTTTPSHGVHSFPLSRLHHHPSLANIPVDMADTRRPPIALHMRSSFDMRSVASQKASTLSGGSPLCREYV